MGQLTAARPSDVDARFLDSVIGGPAGRVVAAHAEPFGTGQVATTMRVTLTWSTGDPGLPASVIVKVAAVDTGSRDAQRRATTYRREVEFYRLLAQRLRVPTPGCLHAAFDDATGAFTLVMTEVDGTAGNQIGGCDAESASAVVQAATGLHAPMWGDTEVLRTMDWLSSNDEESQEHRISRYRQLLPGFLERYAGRLPADVLDTARWLDGRLGTAFRSRRCPDTLVHNDFRIDNMVFSRRDGTTFATVVDWQTVGTGSGPVDLAYALGSSLPEDLRLRTEEALVRDYVESLVRLGVAADGGHVRHDYRLGTVDGLVMAVVASQLVARTPRGDDMFAVMAERHARHMQHAGVHGLIDA